MGVVVAEGFAKVPSFETSQAINLGAKELDLFRNSSFTSPVSEISNCGTRLHLVKSVPRFSISETLLPKILSFERGLLSQKYNARFPFAFVVAREPYSILPGTLVSECGVRIVAAGINLK